MISIDNIIMQKNEEKSRISLPASLPPAFRDHVGSRLTEPEFPPPTTGRVPGGQGSDWSVLLILYPRYYYERGVLQGSNHALDKLQTLGIMTTQ